jgi:hypothetical protein
LTLEAENTPIVGRLKGLLLRICPKSTDSLGLEV